MLLALKPAAGSSSCVVAPSKAHVAVGTAAPKTVPCWRRHATATFNNNSRRRATLMSATGGGSHTTPGMDALSGDAERREIAPGTPRYAHREVPAESTSPGLPTPAGRTVGDETAAAIQGRRIFQDAATTDMSPPAEVGNPILTSAGLMAAMVAGPDEELPGDEIPPQYNVVFDRDRMSGGGIAGVTGTEGVPGGPHGEYRHDVVGGGGDIGDVGGGGGGATR